DGTMFVVSYVCERGAIRSVVPPERLPEAVAQREARQFGAILAGPPLGGLLFGVSRVLHPCRRSLVSGVDDRAVADALGLPDARGRTASAAKRLERADPGVPVAVAAAI